MTIRAARMLVVLSVAMINCVLAAQEAPPDTAKPGDGVALEKVKARGVPVVQMVRVEEPPVIDGRLDDPQWDQAPVLDGFRQVDPIENAEPSERTEIRLLYDSETIYVSVQCFDREPDKIVAKQLQREGDLRSDERIRILFDTFFDRRNGFFFEMNPNGARVDALIENNDNVRFDWDGIWDGDATIDDQGWAAEMAIPTRTLNFDPEQPHWSFNAARYIRRHNEWDRWTSYSQNKPFHSVADAGVISGLEDLEQGLGVDFKPFGVTTFTHDRDRGRDDFDFDAGFDLFYKITPSLTFAGTVNTDFAETEVDERRVNLTRFPLFFPEKRDFFLQDAGIFDFGGINRNPLPFHSRRIGLGPDREPRDILAGVKLTGRVDRWNIGLLDVQMDDVEQLDQQNLFVGRVSANVLDESNIGAMFTHGDPQSTGENYVAGLDFNYRNSTFNGDKVVESNLWYQQSESTDASGEQNAMGFKLRYPNDRINWSMGFTRIDDQFNAALGFVPRRGIHEYFANWRYRWRPENDLIRRIDSGIGTFVVTDLNHNIESRDLDFNIISVETESDDEISLSASREREVLRAPFEIFEDVTIPAGDYKWDRYRMDLSTSTGRPFGFSLGFEHGDFFTGRRTDYEAGVEWRVSKHLFLGAEYELNDVKLDEGSFDTRIARARVNMFFTPDLSWTTFAQWDNVSNRLGINSRVRWIVEPGNEIFVVLNQSFRGEDLRFSAERTELTTKVEWTFRF